MRSSVNSPRKVKEKVFAYEQFIGIDSLRDITSQDTGKKQALRLLSNGYIDPAGQIVRSPGADRIQSAANVVATKHLDIFTITWIERYDAKVRLVSSDGHNADIDWNVSAIPSMANYNGQIVAMAQGQIPYFYSGATFQPAEPKGALGFRLRPGFGVTVQGRFAVAGMPQYFGIVEISRVNNLKFFSEEESKDEVSVTRAGKIDVQSEIGARDPITGLHAFETNKLIIFTGSRGLIYEISTNIDNWKIEDRTTISDGCISHNTIQTAGADVLYCSRTGVHSIIRSRQNGVMVYSVPMSNQITLLYRQLVRSVPDPRSISAVWDADTYQYHIFFPSGGLLNRRLTMSVNPTDMQSNPRWSLSEGFLAETCGDFYQGSLVYGSPDGLFQIGQIEDEDRAKNPLLEVETPILYLGSFTDTKTINSLVVSAYGDSLLTLDLIEPNTRKVLKSVRIRVTKDAAPGEFFGAPLTELRQIPINVRTSQLQLRVTAEGAGLFRLAGFAFIVED